MSARSVHAVSQSALGRPSLTPALAPQLCVSPDYVLVPRSIAKEFYAAVRKVYASFFPVDHLDPESNWGKIINDANFKRVKNMLDETRGEIILGGQSDSSRHRIALAVVTGVKLDDPLMEE